MKTTSEKLHEKVEFRAEKPGDQVYFDISSIQYKSIGGSKSWLLFIEEHTWYNKSYFLSSKSQMVNKGIEYIHFMEIHNINIATFSYNNAEEKIIF